MENNVVAIIMAGKNNEGMKSNKTQFAQKIYDIEVIKRVKNALSGAGIKDIAIVVNNETEKDIKDILKDEVNYIEQKTCLGTGHAIMESVEYLSKHNGKVLVINGNIPLITADTIKRMLENAKTNNTQATVLTAIAQNPKGFGRIIRSEGSIEKIVEQSNLKEEEEEILEVNAGVYLFEIKKLLEIINTLKKNKTGLYYLTDIIEIMYTKTLKMDTILLADNSEILPANNKIQLEILTRILKMRINTFHMKNGVTIEDTSNTYIYDGVEIGMDTVIHPNTTIKSGVVIGSNCNIGPNAYIRESCKLADNVKVGSFVEIKKTEIDKGSKVPHLSYMGDCKIGANTNIGCGTITCNYDGVHKSKTIIGENGFIGSNVNLVAPVTLGDNVTIAAGSTITSDVPSDTLAIARERQIIKNGWKRPQKD